MSTGEITKAWVDDVEYSLIGESPYKSFYNPVRYQPGRRSVWVYSYTFRNGFAMTNLAADIANYFDSNPVKPYPVYY